MPNNKSINRSVTTYRNGKLVDLLVRPDEFVVRATPDELRDRGLVNRLERTSVHSTRVKLQENEDLDGMMKTIRQDTVAHHSYEMKNSGAEFLITDRVIVTFRKPATVKVLNHLILTYSLVLRKKFSETEYLFQLTDHTLHNPTWLVSTITENESKSVKTCEHDLNHRPVLASLNLPTDEGYQQQWHLHQHYTHPDLNPASSTNCEQAWTLLNHFGSPDVVIGVTDDGCKVGHPDFDSPGKFASWAYFDGPNLIHRDSYAADPEKMYENGSDHGTACCGVIAAEVDANLVVGAAPGCRLLPIKWESEGPLLNINDSNFLDMLNFIKDKVDVLSNSWGASPNETWPENVIDRIRNLAISGGRRGKGIVFVWAAGNENCPLEYSGNLDIPYTDGVRQRSDRSLEWIGVRTSRVFEHSLTRIPGVVYVAALASNGQRSHYSNYGDGVSLTAPSNNVHCYHRAEVPGISITTTSGNSQLITTRFGGTSSATPLVAGIAGLVISANPGLTALDVISILKSTASKNLDMTGYSKTAPAAFDANPTWDISPVAPFDKAAFSQQLAEGTWSPWFGHGRVDAAAAVTEAQKRRGAQPAEATLTKISQHGKAIPDNVPAGIKDEITITESGIANSLEIEVDITHTYIGDLVITLIAPDNASFVLHNRNGGNKSNIRKKYGPTDVGALGSLIGKSITGTWTLKVQDLASADKGKLNFWRIVAGLRQTTALILTDTPALMIPDNNANGVERSLSVTTNGTVKEVEVAIDITHTYVSDLIVTLISPAGTAVPLHNKSGGDADNLINTYSGQNTTALAVLGGEPLQGVWRLKVSDTVADDVGKFNKWTLKLVPA